MQNKDKKIKLSVALAAVAVILIAYIIATGVLIYAFGVRNVVTEKTARVIPYPAASVNNSKFISLSNLEKDLQSVKSFYEKQDFSSTGMRVDFSTADGQKRLKVKEKNLLNKLIEDRIIEMLAAKRGIKITPAQAAQEVDRKLQEYGSKDDVIGNLTRLYGWTLADFEQKIVMPDLYHEQLEKNVKDNSPEDVAAKKKIDAALVELNNKADFAEISRKYSEGESAKNGGELGWFSADQMIPEISLVTLTMSKGDRSGVIASSLGYHIIEIEDKKIEENVPVVKLRQIFVKAENFSDWLLAQEKQFKIYIPLKDFSWNLATQSVNFTDSAMRDFENNLDKNSSGDISVLF